MRFEVLDDAGHPLAEGRDLLQLQRQLHTTAIQQLEQLPANPLQAWIGQDLSAWSFGDLPPIIEQPHGDQLIQRFPALVEIPPGVTLQLLTSHAEQQALMLAGSVRLLQRSLATPIKTLQKQLEPQTQLALARYPGQQPLVAVEDGVLATIQYLLPQQGGIVREQQAFQQRCQQIRSRLVVTALPVLQQLARVVTHYQTLHQQLQSVDDSELTAAVTDMQQQLQQLIYPGFVRAMGIERLPDLVRYLQALQQRLEKLPRQRDQDEPYRLKIAALLQAYQYRCTSSQPLSSIPVALLAVRWMIEELRVSYFAQQLGTAYPISEKRITQVLHQLALSNPSPR